MSTNAQPRVLGRWCWTSRWCTLVHARWTYVAPADATSASCDVRSRDDSGRERPRVAPSADRNVSGPRRMSGVTSASLNVERRNVEWCAVSEPQRQARHVKRATSRAQRGRGTTSACSWRRTRPYQPYQGLIKAVSRPYLRPYQGLGIRGPSVLG